MDASLQPARGETKAYVGVSGAAVQVKNWLARDDVTRLHDTASPQQRRRPLWVLRQMTLFGIGPSLGFRYDYGGRRFPWISRGMFNSLGLIIGIKSLMCFISSF